MIKGKAFRTILALSSLQVGLLATAYGADSGSVEYARGNQTDMARVGFQWKWERRWWEANGIHLGGYWDATVAYWHNKRFENIEGNTKNLASIGITPVFRLQKNDLKGLYGEIGIGAHYLSDLYNNNGRKLSTRFEFGDHVGVGYVFQNNLDIGLRFQHFSNGGIKEPNNGVNFAIIRVGYPF